MSFCRMSGSRRIIFRTGSVSAPVNAVVDTTTAGVRSNADADGTVRDRRHSIKPRGAISIRCLSRTSRYAGHFFIRLQAAWRRNTARHLRRHRIRTPQAPYRRQCRCHHGSGCGDRARDDTDIISLAGAIALSTGGHGLDVGGRQYPVPILYQCIR